jgi:rhodanese-related sulfurtransferase
MRLIRAPLFKALPISELKEVLNRMQRILPNAKDIIVQQGGLGDYYYVVDEGVCSVSRKSLSTAIPIQIADLGPGEAFGEEALITNSPRNATVTAQKNCQLLRLDRQTFIELVHKPLVTEVNRLTADKMIEQGAVWLDVRAPDQFASGSLRGSVNIPFTLLRSDYRGLSQKNQYIVCAETTGAAQVGTLLLKQRGLDATCTRESIAELLQHRQNRKHDSRPGTVVPFPIGGGVTSIQLGNSGSGQGKTRGAWVDGEQAYRYTATVTEIESSGPIPRYLYDDTLVGQSLADLIDQMQSRHWALHAEQSSATTDTDHARDPVDLRDFQDEIRSVFAGTDQPRVAADVDESLDAGPLLPITEQHVSADDLSALTTAFESGIRDYLARRLKDARADAQDEMATHITRVKQAVVKEVRRHIETLRVCYRNEHLSKQTKINSEYDKLMGLAQKVSRQKAQLQRALRELEKKLHTTAQLQMEIDGVRSTLTTGIGNFDTLEDELSGSIK